MTEKIVIKIYMPRKSEGKFLYGHKREEKQTINTRKADKGIKTIVSFFVITTSEMIVATELELLGSMSESATKTSGIQLLLNEKRQVIKVLYNIRELSGEHEILLLNYDKNAFLKCYDETLDASPSDDNFVLFIAKALQVEDEKANGKSSMSNLSSKSLNLLIRFSSIASKSLQIISPIFKNTMIHRHSSNWYRCLTDEHSKNSFVLLDVLLGIIFFLIMSHVQDSGKYFMDSTEFIVNKLRALLETLDGSPVGLKLNVQLNNFLLSCFMYHVDLWWNFIVIVEPAIHYLFVPITVFGFMGFSFQCAILCDLITLITLHAHCFYIYAAMLYKLELSSIRALLRIVLGRRLNVLKSKLDVTSFIRLSNLCFYSRSC